ncbi:hypothetical protein [Sulfoacidibacillus ferrooxidans]|uniref:Phosphoribosyltransferase domain-containing protein n=1 Tax=Sulfoacidibacillus ferrooxidans TaxID=2005001 RepID=A0A9X2ADJ1_9BACL|nr:hypothetical protein [Sulfoacidibacillus ferrooxidans]MCI0183475.1 hypothetical protein [Sulfoacidibacillus ferrooxidans]
MRMVDPLLDLFFPTQATCPLCGGVFKHIPQGVFFPPKLCDRCKQGVTENIVGLCRVCGRAGEGGLCSDCTRTPHLFLEARAFGHYDGTLERVIKGLKYQGDRRFVPILGEWIVEAYLRHYGHARDHLIVPVPMHPKKQSRRGFNQAEDLTSFLVKRLSLPCANVLEKVTLSDSQTTHSRQQRIESLQGAFALNYTNDLTYNQYALHLIEHYMVKLGLVNDGHGHKSSIAQSLAERARWREMIGNRHTNERKHQSQAISSRWHQLRTRVLQLGMVDRRSKRVPSEYQHLDRGSSKAKMMDRWTHSKADEVNHKQYRLAGHLYKREAFIRRLIEGQSILLIDDVLTTGGTADACAEVLYQAGAVGVHVLTIAR